MTPPRPLFVLGRQCSRTTLASSVSVSLADGYLCASQTWPDVRPVRRAGGLRDLMLLGGCPIFGGSTANSAYASIEETEGAYGCLEQERAPGRPRFDAGDRFSGDHQRPRFGRQEAGGESQLSDVMSDDLVVEGKGFVEGDAPKPSELAASSPPEAAPRGTPGPSPSTVSHETPSPDRPPSASTPRPRNSVRRGKRKTPGPRSD